jgi:hypothetical protein
MPEVTLEHTTEEEATDESLPANIQEQQAMSHQMRELNRHSRGNKVRLPVTTVSFPEDNERGVIKLQHPFLGEQVFHFDKPVTVQGDSRLEEVLAWYGIMDNDPYKLQLHRVWVEHLGDGDFEVTKPPSMVSEPTRRERLRERLAEISKPSKRTYTAGNVTALLSFGTLLGTVYASLVTPISLFAVASILVFQITMMAVSIVVIEDE